jgi:hypothetical protein
MTNRIWPIDAVNGAPAQPGRGLRQLQSPLLLGATSARPLGAISGVRPGTPTTTVLVTSTTWACAPHAGVLDLEAANEAGPYTYAVDETVTGQLTAANASNPRTDLIYVQMTDNSEDGTTPGQPGKLVVGYLAGVPGATAPVPATPPRSLVLARVNVPRAGAGNPTATWVAPHSVGAGGTLPVETLALLRALPGWTGGHASVTNDPDARLNGDYRWTGTATGWQREGATLIGSRGVLRGASAPTGTGLLIQTGNDVLGTNAGGDTTLNFPVAFPNGLLSVQVMSGDSSAGRFTVAVNGTGGSTSAINLHLDREGSNLGGISVRVSWLAIGW